MSTKRVKISTLIQEQGSTRKLDIISLQIKALYLTGVLVPKGISSSTLKTNIFNIYTFFSIFWFIPSIITQTVALYEIIGSIEETVSVIFQILCYISTVTIAFYFAYNRKKLLNLYDTLETKFVPHIEKVGLPSRHKSILRETSKQASFITWMMFTIGVTIFFLWGCVPFFTGYIEYIIGIDEEVLKLEQRRYFGLVMWLPPNVNQSPIYEATHLFHMFSVFTICTNFGGCNMVFFSFMIHISTQFKMLAASLNDMNEVIQENQESVNEINGSMNVEDISDKRNNLKTMSTLRNNTGIFEVASGGHSATSNTTHDYNGDKCSETELLNGEQQDEKIYRYFIDCIEYHQALLEYYKDVNEFLSPVLLVFFVFNEAMMCLTAILVALGLSGNIFKFTGSAANSFIWPVIICWYGDHFTQQCLAVEKAVYECNWIDKSTKFKILLRIVIMRAQQPVRFTAGKFYFVSLETLADMCNKVYAFYTVVQQIIN